MAFINWGHETPEQREIRRRLDEIALYEQAVQMAMAKGGTAAGGSIPFSFYGFGSNPGENRLIKIRRNGSVIAINETALNGIGTLCKNPETGKTYVIYQDTEESQMVVGSVNTSTGVVTEIDRTVLTGATYSSPCSLFHLSGNSYMYLENNLFLGESEGNIQRVFLLNISDDEVTVETTIGTLDTDSLGLFTTSIFKTPDGDTWGAVTPPGYPFAGFAKYDLGSNLIIEANPLYLENYPNSEMIKIYFVFGLTQGKDGKLYGVVYGEEKDNAVNLLCIAELDPLNYRAIFVQSLDLDIEWLPVDIEII